MCIHVYVSIRAYVLRIPKVFNPRPYTLQPITFKPLDTRLWVCSLMGSFWASRPPSCNSKDPGPRDVLKRFCHFGRA